ncbi:MAG: type II toxin-antitoxin system death-on-curing family toxin [Bacillota bacterium]
MIELLDLEDILQIHKEAINIFGGSSGFYHDTEAKIRSVLEQQNPHFVYDKYPNVFQKAAMLWYFFTKDHCFVDGNKRVGFYAAATLLKINGYSDTTDDNEAFDQSIKITCSKLTGPQRDDFISELAKWLHKRFI